tara:strand:- start:1094 stop:1207 length:114 start_codon:yes stop_codon:yes gene_type:complete
VALTDRFDPALTGEGRDTKQDGEKPLAIVGPIGMILD